MAQINSNLVVDFRKALIKFVESLVDDSASFGGIDLGDFNKIEDYNIDTITKLYIGKFTDDLKLQNVDTWGAKRIAKEWANEIRDDVMAEVN